MDHAFYYYKKMGGLGLESHRQQILQAPKSYFAPQEVTMADFQSNFDQLKQANVIPDVDENMLPQTVKDVIGNLTDDEIAVLVNISNKTGSHIYLNKGHIVICGF